MMKLLWIALGGGLGASLRYLLSSGIAGSSRFEGFRPAATLVVNILGCLAIGFFARVGASEWKEEWRLALFVGLFGGFTTFSTYALECFELFAEGQRTSAILNLLLSNLLGLGAVGLGMRLAGLWSSAAS